MGDFILHFLNNEGVETRFIPRKAERRTSAVVLGIEPPDKFPLVYYRDNCADINLTIDDVLAAPIGDCRVFQFAGTNLSLEPSRSATLFAAEQARLAGAKVVFDVDFRPDQWHDVRAFGVVARGALPLVDVVIGTEDEINAALLSDVSQMNLTHSQISDTKVAGDTRGGIEFMLTLGSEAVVEKIGPEGARVHLKSGEIIDAPGFPVAITNILGAGDAFGGGLSLWAGQRLGLVQIGAAGQCLRRHRGHRARPAPISCRLWPRSRLSSRPTADWINRGYAWLQKRTKTAGSSI